MPVSATSMTFGRSVCRALAGLVLLLSVTVIPLAAQEPAGEGSTGKAWLTGGLGTGTEGFAAVASVDLSWDRHIVFFRSATTQPFLGSGDRCWDAGILYGGAVRWPEGLAAVPAGFGVMGCERTDRRPSLPAAARVSWHPTSEFGLGACTFVDINREDAFGGLALTPELCVLR